MVTGSSLYVGTVTHKRLRPVRHRLDYRVFSVCIDLAELVDLDRRSWLFAYNRRAPLSFYDRDHGDRSGTPIRAQVTALAATAGVDLTGGRIRIFCYPRVFGYVFNPLTVFFCDDAVGRLACLVYEVSNTFGERHSYVLPVPASDGSASDADVFQQCDKAMFVSPFNGATGRYTFHIRPPGARVAVGVMLRDDDGPKLKALFEGAYRPFNDLALARVLLALPFLTLKVVLAIHYEALKLWMKRLPLLTKPAAPRFAVSMAAQAGAVPTKPLDDPSVFGFAIPPIPPVPNTNRLS